MFSIIAVVDARRDYLIVNAFPNHVVIEDEGSLIVQLMQLRLKTCSSEASMEGLVCM
jgi:hypothetical protein